MKISGRAATADVISHMCATTKYTVEAPASIFSAAICGISSSSAVVLVSVVRRRDKTSAV